MLVFVPGYSGSAERPDMRSPQRARHTAALAAFALLVLLGTSAHAQAGAPSMAEAARALARIRALRSVSAGQSLTALLASHPRLITDPDVASLLDGLGDPDYVETLRASGIEGVEMVESLIASGATLPRAPDTASASGMQNRIAEPCKTLGTAWCELGRQLAAAQAAALALPDADVLLPAGCGSVAGCMTKFTDGEASGTGHPLLEPEIADLPEDLRDAIQAHARAAEEAAVAIRGCAGDLDCVETIAQRVGSESWLKKRLESTCMGRNPNALKALGYTYLVAYGSLGLALFAGAQNDRFPFDVAINTLIMTAFWAEMGCRTTFENVRADEEQLGYWRDAWRAFLRFLPWQPVGVATQLFWTGVEDAVRGDDVFTEERLHSALKDALFQLPFAGLWNTPKGVLVYNPLFLKVFPRFRLWLNVLFREHIINIGPLPGAAAELAARWATGAFDTYTFLKLRTYFAREPEEQPKPEASTPRDQSPR